MMPTQSQALPYAALSRDLRADRAKRGEESRSKVLPCGITGHAGAFLPPSAAMSSAQRGKASAIPPSIGKVAPVVGVWLVAKKTTALPTCSAVTAAFRRLRWR